ncbi:GyrI-like domain-containing protein [Brevibacillus brevis]|uniref:GyrI-like domain-containing protein n=1 Tax=Brevibacillus brevis TaxID=1393 RepID=A0ABY9T997_BREBE|nr:GyrI-like domain-containing protein [Brevibacillus brevis]WNC16680.1 GyrI-like domain-containing protein [Brevibacillus brevis]
MSGRISVVPSKNVIAVSFSGTFPALVKEMPGVWEAFLQRQSEIPHVVSPHVRFDISSENRSYQLYTEYIGVEVERFERIPAGMVGLTLPERTYACFTHSGPMDQVQETYRNAFRWLGEEGYRVDESALRFERYDERYTPGFHNRERKENAYDIFIPLL